MKLISLTVLDCVVMWQARQLVQASGYLSLIQYNLPADLLINDELTEKYIMVTIYLHYNYILIVIYMMG